MNYIVVKNNIAIKYIDNVENYIQYVIKQYNNYIYIQKNIEIDELHDTKYNDGLYIILCDNNEIKSLQKSTIQFKGYIYNSNQINIEKKDRWLLLKNDIEKYDETENDDDIENDIKYELDTIHNNLLDNYIHMINIIDKITMVNYKDFNIDTILDCSSVLFISENNRNSIDSQHSIIEYVLDNNNINETDMYIYNTDMYTKITYHEKFRDIQTLDNLLLDTFTIPKKQILVIELNNNIIKNKIVHHLLNNNDDYNLTIIGIIKPQNINTKLNFNVVIMYDIINTVCSNSNIYRTIYRNTIKNMNYTIFLHNINVENKYIIYNNI
jgi:hypothetical protein